MGATENQRNIIRRLRGVEDMWYWNVSGVVRGFEPCHDWRFVFYLDLFVLRAKIFRN